MNIFWLSFADAFRPPGQRFLGVAIVEAKDSMGAIEKAWDMGVNPGGQVLAIQIRPEDHQICAGMVDRLLDSEETLQLSEQFMAAARKRLH